MRRDAGETETGVDWTVAGLDGADEEAPAGREEGAPAEGMETSSFPEAAGQQDDKETSAGLDTGDEEAPLSPSAISPSSRTTDGTGTDGTGADTADDTEVGGTVIVDVD